MRTTILIAASSVLLVSNANAQMPPPSVSGTAAPGTFIRDEGRKTSDNTKTFDRIEPLNTFKAVETSYRMAHVVPTTIDRAGMRMFYVASPAPRSIGTVRLKDAFNCGGTKDAPVAELVDLEVTIRSEVSSYGAAGSQVITVASATPLASLPSGELPVCKSMRRLELKLEPNIRTKTVTTVKGVVRPG